MRKDFDQWNNKKKQIEGLKLTLQFMVKNATRFYLK